MTIRQQVRREAPLIHHLTNEVVMNFTANGLLAYGGSPIMAKELKEVAEISAAARGVLINIGTLTETTFEAMKQAGIAANEAGVPVVLDPVGVAATTFRSEAVNRLLQDVKLTAIKGNAGEMAYLAGVTWKTKGVESTDGEIAELKKIAQQIAKTYDTIAIVTGKTDVLSDGNVLKTNDTGDEQLTRITGAGCLLGSLVTANIAVSDDPLQAAYEAVVDYGAAAERAIAHPDVSGPGTFVVKLIDELQA